MKLFTSLETFHICSIWYTAKWWCVIILLYRPWNGFLPSTFLRTTRIFNSQILLSDYHDNTLVTRITVSICLMWRQSQWITSVRNVIPHAANGLFTNCFLICYISRCFLTLCCVYVRTCVYVCVHTQACVCLYACVCECKCVCMQLHVFHSCLCCNFCQFPDDAVILKNFVTNLEWSLVCWRLATYLVYHQ